MNPLRFLWAVRRVVTRPPTAYRLGLRRPATLLARLQMEGALLLEGRAPFDLKQLAALRTAALVGCTW